MGQKQARNRACLAVAIILAILAGCAEVKRASEGTPPKDHLAVAVPKGWVQVWDRFSLNSRTIEFVPKGQDIHNWSDMLIVNVLSRQALPAPLSYLPYLEKSYSAGCDEFGGIRLNRLFTNEPDEVTLPDWTAFTLNCGSSDFKFTSDQSPEAHGEMAFYYVMRATDVLFAVKRAWRTKPFDMADSDAVSKEMLADKVKAEELRRIMNSKLCSPADKLSRAIVTQEEAEIFCREMVTKSSPTLKDYVESGDTILVVGDQLK